MYFSERVLATTQDYMIPKLVDNVLNSNILSLRLMGNAKKGKGESIKKAIKYTNSGTATSFSGLDTFTATPLNTKIRLSYDMRGIRQPIGISGFDAVANGVDDTQVTDLIKMSIEETEQELVDAIGTMLYSTGTGNGGKDFLGIGAIIDDGTDVATIGEQSRSTYSVLNSTRTAATNGVVSQAVLSTLFSNVSSGNSQTYPTLIVSNETVWDLYEQLLTPTVRETYSDMGMYNVTAKGTKRGLTAHSGFVAITFKGIPWVRDEKAPTGKVYMINENWLDWYGWDANNTFGYKKISLSSSTIEGNYDEAPMSDYSGFNWSGLRAPTNQFAGIADVIVLGNLTSWAPRRHGVLTGVTTI